jgi:hypothetical protein
MSDQYLTHYWPFVDSTMKDVIGSAHMTQGANTTFTSDRFGNPNSALALNTGYTQVPSGVYFNTPSFTISVWVYPDNIVSNWARVMDFSNGAGEKTILFSISSSNNFPALGIWNTSSTCIGNFASSIALVNNKWQFLVATFDGTTANVYINGSLTYSRTISLYTLPTVIRTQNWIGKSAWIGNGYSSSFLDDLRFYNISLSQAQILEIMNYQTTTTTTTTTTITTTTASSKTCIFTEKRKSKLTENLRKQNFC